MLICVVARNRSVVIIKGVSPFILRATVLFIASLGMRLACHAKNTVQPRLSGSFVHGLIAGITDK